MQSISPENKEWGKRVTIIANSGDGNITREDYLWPLQHTNKSENVDNGNSVCQIRLSNLESQNKQLNDYIKNLKDNFETTQHDLQVCQTDQDISSDIIPYFYNSNYETLGSSTIIHGNNWKILVWLIGKSPNPDDPLILHPLGDNRISRLNISPIQEISFDLVNDEKGPIVGSALGHTMMFKGAPIIKFKKFSNVEGTPVDFSSFRLPLLFRSK